MIQYSSDDAAQLNFLAFHPRIERRDEQWVDIELELVISPASQLPAEITNLTALVICTVDGVIAQIVPLDEGCDCEFQFTAEEKGQIREFVERPEIQRAITNLSSSC